MMNEETKASLNKFLKQREERIKNMTLAEARNVVNSIYGHSDMRMESDKALQMLLDCADKTLEQQPSEDCIRRQAVIILIDEASEIHPYKVVGDSDTYSNYNQGWSDACDWLYANIEGVPSVIPQRKMGKWIEVLEHRDEFGSTWHCECSECRAMSYKGFEPLEKYCPNCGAEMSGGEEDGKDKDSN